MRFPPGQTPTTMQPARFSSRLLSPLLLSPLLLAACLAAPLARAAEVGASAPDFSLPGASATVSLQEFRGKVVYLDFWASWCGPCRTSFPWMNEMQARYGAQGFQVVAVNLDTNAREAKKFLDEVPAQFLIAFDAKGETPRRYAIKGMPTSVMIGRDGKVVSQHVGFHLEKRAELEEKIRAALGEKP